MGNRGGLEISVLWSQQNSRMLFDEGHCLKPREMSLFSAEKTVQGAPRFRPRHRQVPLFLFQNIVYIKPTPELGHECRWKKVSNLGKVAKPSHFHCAARQTAFLVALCMEEANVDGMVSQCPGKGKDLPWGEISAPFISSACSTFQFLFQALIQGLHSLSWFRCHCEIDLCVISILMAFSKSPDHPQWLHAEVKEYWGTEHCPSMPHSPKNSILQLGLGPL